MQSSCVVIINQEAVELAGSIPAVLKKYNVETQTSKEVIMAKVNLAVRASRKWAVRIGFSIALGTGMTAIQPNGV